MMHLAPRSRADVRDLRAGEWLRSPQHVWFRCPACKSTVEIDPHDYGIAASGDVKPTFVCPDVLCGVETSLRLMSWTGGEIGTFDTSDAEAAGG